MVYKDKEWKEDKTVIISKFSNEANTSFNTVLEVNGDSGIIILIAETKQNWSAWTNLSQLYSLLG